jgi:hypothetical protein
LDPELSSITSTERIALGVTVMDMCQKFFAYKLETCCGYPSITLDGTYQDWKNLSVKTKEILTKRCRKQFAEWWMASLIPLLDKIADEYKLA